MSENISHTPTYNYCYCRRGYNSRAKLIKTKAKISMPEISRNPFPPVKSLLLPTTPAIDNQIAAVKRGNILLFFAWLNRRIYLALKLPEIFAFSKPSRTENPTFLLFAISPNNRIKNGSGVPWKLSWKPLSFRGSSFHESCSC